MENSKIISVFATEEPQQTPISAEVTKDKPFNQCFECEYFRNGCSGPNLSVMTVPRVAEFFQICRQRLGMSYQKLADLTGFSIITVKRVLNGQTNDPGFLIIQALSRVLVGDPNEKHPCAMHLVSAEAMDAAKTLKEVQTELQKKDAEFDRLRADDKKQIDFLLKQNDFKEEQLREKDKLLHERFEFIKRKDRVIFILGFSLFLCMLLIMGALVVDRLNPNIGFFWIH